MIMENINNKVLEIESNLLEQEKYCRMKAEIQRAMAQIYEKYEEYERAINKIERASDYEQEADEIKTELLNIKIKGY